MNRRSRHARIVSAVLTACLASLAHAGITAAQCIDYRDYLRYAGGVETPRILGAVDTPGTAYGVAVSGHDSSTRIAGGGR